MALIPYWVDSINLVDATSVLRNLCWIGFVSGTNEALDLVKLRQELPVIVGLGRVCEVLEECTFSLALLQADPPSLLHLLLPCLV